MNIPLIIKNTIRQLFDSRLLLLKLYTPIALVMLSLGLLVNALPDLKLAHLTRDVTSLGKMPIYYGALSQVGLLLWSATTTICFFTYFYLKSYAPHRSESLRFLLYFGILTLYLLLDDTFLLHEEFFSDYLNIPEKVILVLLMGFTVGFAYFNFKEILQNELGLFALAGLLFGSSLFLDVIADRIFDDFFLFEKIEHLLEDGAKMAGIVTWAVYFSRYSFRQISTAFIKSQ